MKKILTYIMVACASLIFNSNAKAEGWPANYQGVMLQGFYWDSYNDSKWTVLESKADELSKYFTLIWVPNSAQSMGSPTMGYLPIYWFTHHNSSFGTEAQLRKMIATYKAKGVGIIEDVVVNHRVGVSGWYDFPAETYNGKTYRLTNGAICSTDEMWKGGGQGCPYTRGNADTGDDFDGGRDLDHTNSEVQAHIKDYCKFLIDDLGYAGFRLDMVKGYGGQYTKMYNQYSKPKFCVGEYFDGNYDLVAGWIEATGRESAAFDFPFKYAVNEAFASNDMSKLTWLAGYTTPQPAGMIHYGYQRYAVTFIDNHDTYRDDWNIFKGDVVAANAFMLCSPGTPCVFYRHYLDNKTAIQKLIDARNSVGVHNMSAVNVLKATANCYMAEVTGTKGKLVVRIGTSTETPAGYSSSDIYCSGTRYCVWTSNNGGVIPDNPDKPDNPGGSYPATLYMLGNVNGTDWSTEQGIAATGNNGVYSWSSVTVDDVDEGYGYFAFTTRLGSTWDEVNSSDRYGAPATNTPIAKGGKGNVTLYAANVNAGGSQSWKIAAGTYSVTVDLASMTVSVGNPGETPQPQYPAKLYLMGHVKGYDWDPSKGIEAAGSNGVYKWNDVTIDDADSGSGYVSFASVLGSNSEDWDAVNGAPRYGASSENAPLSEGQTASIMSKSGGDAWSTFSWKIPAGNYDVTADLSKMQVALAKSSGIDSAWADDDSDAPVEYYNLQGVRVLNPTSGLYIRVKGRKAQKVLLP